MVRLLLGVTYVGLVQIEISEVLCEILHHLRLGTSSVLGLKAGIRLTCEGGDAWLDPFPGFLPALDDYLDCLSIPPTCFLLCYRMLQSSYPLFCPLKSACPKDHPLRALPRLQLWAWPHPVENSEGFEVRRI